ncbi:winged helix-turn-helix transcriptional regulator [Altererythrobacter sp.]|uniref:winged helix-turn-helix transcriptional regulator n=1 Tax=Altererythrobacter sp. TaxID=1872480 RepID=UPI003D01DC2A
MKSQKVTNVGSAVHGKWYGDACGTAFALELVGERWSLLIIRELMLGPRRFSDLRASLPGISAKVLTERLASLEDAAVLVKRKLAPPASSQVYELTEWGYRAEPAIQELGRWAAMSSGHDPLLPLSPVSLMLSLRTMFDPAKAEGWNATIGFDLAGETFVARLEDGSLPIERGDPQSAQAIFRAPAAPVIAGMFYAGAPVDELERDAGLAIEGDRATALRFADIFELPEKLT